VTRLIDSITRIGLLTPISVRWAKDAGGADDLILVAGRHRLEACLRLDRPIECLVLEGEEVDCRLLEIAENLHRAELTVQERSDHIAEWVKLTGEKVVSAQVGPKLSTRGHADEGRPESGINAAVRELGITRQEGQRAVKIAGLSDEARAVARETGQADNQAVLLKAAREPDSEAQAASLRRQAEGAPGRRRAA
jgi:ParB family chromosome partitioning protein